jgi:hypothetical protein
MNRTWIGLVSLLAVSFSMAQADDISLGPPTWDVNVVASPAVVEYRVVGATEARTNGDAGGVAGLHGMCQSEFGSEARACTSVEVVRSPEISGLPANTLGWVLPVVASQGVIFDPIEQRFMSWMTDVTGVVNPNTPATGSAQDAIATMGLSCNGWNNDTIDRAGVAFKLGALFWAQCENELPVLCCAPRD